MKLVVYVLVAQNEMLSCNPVQIDENRGSTQSSYATCPYNIYGLHLVKQRNISSMRVSRMQRKREHDSIHQNVKALTSQLIVQIY